ncbi:MAG: ArsB/NhaD family transporter [Alphaproteobacteria bacterium]|nr:ArsB/NhaD family transporter [Alphaproteobacteria bacterium]
MTGDLIFGYSQEAVALVLMCVCYLLLFTEKMNRAVVTIVMAGLAVMLGVLSQKEAISSIDFNTISLLVGMMIVVNVAERSGMFQYVAIWGAKKVRAHPLWIMVVLGLVTAVFSAFLDNVTTVLLIVPVSLQIANKLEVNPYPYLLINIFASNIGGTATLIGDPPNILIGSSLGLSFTDFLVNLSGVIIVILALVVLMFIYFWKDSLKTTMKNRAVVMNINEKDAILDWRLLKISLFVLFAVIFGFVMAEHIGLNNGLIALIGAGVCLLLYTFGMPHAKRDDMVEDVLNHVDWTTIFFFIGLFVIVGALEVTGFLHKMGQYFIEITDGSIKKSVFVILGVSAVFSAVVDNIPFVATMIPMIKTMEEAMGGREVMMPVWWALSLGACLGGNGSLIGASANVIVAGIAIRAGRPISFLRFLIWSIPVMVLSVIISGIYLYLKYFM